MSSLLISGMLIGAGATLAMDLWAILLNRAFGQPLPNWGFVGRWVGHLPRGRFVHSAIAEADHVANETALGWTFHYAVGIAYGLLFLAIVGSGWMAAPTFLSAWIFALITIGAGWFILQPGLGLGIAASRTPAPWVVRGHNILGHTAFALGLWATALVIG